MAPRATKQHPKPTTATLEKWFVTSVPSEQSENRGPLRVWGMPVGGSASKKLWRSSSIVRRISSNTLETRFNTRVVLKGPIDSAAALETSMTPEAVDAFAHGFPLAWKSIAANAFTSTPRGTRDTLPELPILPPTTGKVTNARKRPSEESKSKTKTKTRVKAKTKNGNAKPSASRKRGRNTQTVLQTIPISNFLPDSKRSRRATEPAPQPYGKASKSMGRNSTGNPGSQPRKVPRLANDQRAKPDEVDSVDVKKRSKQASKQNNHNNNMPSPVHPPVDNPVEMNLSPPPHNHHFATPLPARDNSTTAYNSVSKDDDEDDDHEYHTPPMEQSENVVRTKSPPKKAAHDTPRKDPTQEKHKRPMRGESTDTDAKLRDSADLLMKLMNQQHSKNSGNDNNTHLAETTAPHPSNLMGDDVETEEDEAVSDANEIPRSALAVRNSILQDNSPMAFKKINKKPISRPPKKKAASAAAKVAAAAAASENSTLVPPFEIQDAIAAPSTVTAQNDYGEKRTERKGSSKECVAGWTFDKLLKKREDEVKSGNAAAFPEPVKRDVIAAERFYPRPKAPTPIYSMKNKTKRKSSKKGGAPARAETENNNKKKKNNNNNNKKVAGENKKGAAAGATKKNSNASQAKKKRAADTSGGSSKRGPTKRRKISFKDQLVEVEDEPQKQRGGRRAARIAQAAMSSMVATPPATPTANGTGGVFWTKEQIEAFDRLRKEIPPGDGGGSEDYWKRLAQGVEGRSAQECQERWWGFMETPEKNKKKNGNNNNKKRKGVGKSTPELALNYAEHGVTKAHTKTAKFSSNMRRIVAANTRDVIASQEQIYEPPRVAGYSPTTPLGVFPSDSSSYAATPGTEARERRKEMEPPKFDTPEPFARNSSRNNNNSSAPENSVADRIVAQFKKRFGSVLNAAVPVTDEAPGDGNNKKKASGPDMEDVVREMKEKKKRQRVEEERSSEEEEERETEDEEEDALI